MLFNILDFFQQKQSQITSDVSFIITVKPQDKTLVRNNWQMCLLAFSSITSRHVF
jgi:hypothetical protein